MTSRPGRERKLDGKQEAHLVAVACSSPPGTRQLDLQLLAGRWWSWSLPRASPWRRCARYSKKRTQTLPRLSGEFVARMEDVLDLYANPTTRTVQWSFDETSRQLLGEVRPPIAATPGRVARYDTEYQRNGTRNLFMFCEPKGGWRHSR